MKLIRLPEVEGMVHIKRNAIYRMMKQDRFPLPIKIGSGSFWVEDEIVAYLQRLMSARRASQPTESSS